MIFRKKILFVLLLLGQHAFSQKAYNVLDWKTEYTLNTYLLAIMHKQYAARQKEFEKAVSSRSNAVSYLSDCRKKYLSLLGNMPERTPLHPNITGSIEREGYRIEKIIFESFKGHHVTSNLYIPSGKGPFPAVLLFCGHEDAAKATMSYQQTAILFARNGYVVLVVDPVSQSERYQLTDKQGKPLTRGGTTEHSLLNEIASLTGNSLPAYSVWDNTRSLDYLVSRSEVDTARIGCLGNSGGGMQTIYFAGFDNRIKVIAPCSYLATRERTLELSGAADGCAQMPNEGKEQMELNDYLAIAAPKPLLILAGRYDFIDYTGTETAYNELKHLYKALGAEQKLSLFTVDDGHGISQPKREAAVAWFNRWLKNEPSPVKETNSIISTEKELQVTASGQVNSSYEEVTIPARSLQLFDEMAGKRDAFLQLGHNQQLKQIIALTGIDTGAVHLEKEKTGSAEKAGIVYQKWILRRQGQPPLPLLITYPTGAVKKVILCFDDGGKNKMADSVILVKEWLNKGFAVILADLRGMGETEDKPELNDAKYYNKEYRNAMLALHIGKPLIGQRATDILTVLSFIHESSLLTALPVEISAGGTAAISALHAMMFDKRVEQLHIYNSIHSFKEILETPLDKNRYGYIIPGVLEYYDIPDLASIAGAGRVQY